MTVCHGVKFILLHTYNCVIDKRYERVSVSSTV